MTYALARSTTLPNGRNERVNRLFPRALLECIVENRQPGPYEVEQLADKVRREAFGSGSDWDSRWSARRLAHAAFHGHTLCV